MIYEHFPELALHLYTPHQEVNMTTKIPFLILLPFLLSARQDRPVSLAIYGIKGIGIEHDLALTIQEHLESNLPGYSNYTIVSRNDMEKVISENRLQQTGICIDDACVLKAGALLGVDELITGTISHLGNTYNIVLKLITVDSGTIVSSVNTQYSGPVDSLLSASDKALGNLMSRKPMPRNTKTDTVRITLRDTVYSTITVPDVPQSYNLEKVTASQQEIPAGEEVKTPVKTAQPSSPPAGSSMGRKVGTGAVLLFSGIALVFLITSVL
jgi:hypothetical protein